MPACLENAVVVGHIDGEDAGFVGDRCDVGGTGGAIDDHHDFPGAGRDDDFAVEAARLPGSSGDNVEFLALFDEGAAVGFEVFPGAAIVGGDLGHDVGQDKGGDVVIEAAIAIGGGGHVAPIEFASVVIAGDLGPVLGEIGVAAKAALAGDIAEPTAVELPADPVGRTPIAIVGQGKLGLDHQVVGRLVEVSRRITGIAEEQVGADHHLG